MMEELGLLLEDWMPLLYLIGDISILIMAGIALIMAMKFGLTDRMAVGPGIQDDRWKKAVVMILIVIMVEGL